MTTPDDPDAFTDTSYVLSKFLGDDRRRFKRWQVNVSIRELEPESHVYLATSVSAGGFLCPDASPRLPGEELTVEVDFGKGEPLTTQARVVHCGKGKDGLGLALQFVAPQHQVEHMLRLALGSFDWGGSPDGD